MLPSRLALAALPHSEESLRLLEQLHDTMAAQQHQTELAYAQVREPIQFVLVEPSGARHVVA